MFDERFKKRPGENRYSYTWRIGKYISTRREWEEMTPIINKELELDYGESAHRKLFALSKIMWETVFSEMSNEEYTQELRKLELEVERTKQKERDERNEFRRLNRKLARSEENFDMLLNAVEKSKDIPYSPIIVNKEHSLKNENIDLIVALSDWHIGECFSNAVGKYNSDIALERLRTLSTEIADLQKLYCANNIYVVMLGDMISGNIHTTVSMTNRENVVEQVQKCSQLLSWFLAEISPLFNNIIVNGVPGNHSRVSQNKDDCLPGERLDLFIPDIADCKLRRQYKDVKNVSFESDSIEKYDHTISSIEVKGNKFIIIHGDYDNVNSKASIAALEEMVNFRPYGIICGHKHFFMSDYSNRTKIYQSGCLGGGGNDYTIKKRLSGAFPCQLVLACSNKGVKGVHPITL
ncbi:MAG: hypothetical protein RR370_01775 [Synergistaceae bacterium]